MPYAPLPDIAEDTADLRRRLGAARDPERKRRLHALVLLASGQATTRREVAAHLAVDRQTVARWLGRYRDGGLDGMLKRQKPGPAPGQRTLDAPVLDAPVLDAPVLDAPVLDAPVLDAPVLDAPVLDAPVLDALRRRLDDPTGFASYVAVRAWLHEAYGLDIPYKSVYTLVRYRLGAKLKVPRPEHPKKA